MKLTNIHESGKIVHQYKDLIKQRRELDAGPERDALRRKLWDIDSQVRARLSSNPELDKYFHRLKDFDYRIKGLVKLLRRRPEVAHRPMNNGMTQYEYRINKDIIPSLDHDDKLVLPYIERLKGLTDPKAALYIIWELEDRLNELAGGPHFDWDVS